jgi:toxin HigB-1
MIKSFRHKGLKRFYERGDASSLLQSHVKRLRLILTQLDAAKHPQDMSFPGSGLHSLKGRLKGHWAVSVSGNWRVTFRFQDSDVYDVDYQDYH